MGSRIISYILMIAMFLFPCGAEQIEARYKPNFGQLLGDECHAQFPGYLHGGSRRLPVQHSFTDEFLHFLRERTQAQEAANQLAAEDLADQDQVLDDAVDVDWNSPHDLSVLEGQGGDRLFQFYRPNPNQLQRPLSLRFHALPASSIADIQQALIRTWPDLGQPDIGWRAVEVHETVEYSIQIETDLKVYLLHVSVDTQGGLVPVLQEYQTWSLQDKWYDSIIVPVVLPALIRGKTLMHERQEGHACHYKPCFAAKNGQILQVGEEYDLHSADYVIVMALNSVEGIVSAIGYWTDFMGQEAIHTDAFPRLTGVTMALGTDIPLIKGRINARILQVALSTTYRTLYGQYQGHQIARGHILGIALADYYIPDEVHAVSMTEFQVGNDHSREFPWVLEGLIRAAMLKDSWSGTFVIPRDQVRQLSLPETLNAIDQVLLVRPMVVPTMLAWVLVEIRVDGPLRGTQAFREQELMAIFTAHRCTREDMLRHMHMQEDCQQAECLLSLNDRVVTESNEVHRVPEGSILRIWYVIHHHQHEPPEQEEDVVIQEESPTPAQRSRQLDSTSSRSSDGHDPQYVPGTFLQNLVLIFTLFLSRRQRVEKPASLRTSSSKQPSRSTRCRPLRSRCHFGFPWKILLFGLLTFCARGNVLSTFRIGEAQHPGPEYWIGTTNPSGAAGKKRILAEMPEGVWGITETHLSGINQKPVLRNIRRAANPRCLHCLPGAPVSLRARSASTGVWAGVMNISDLIMRDIKMQSLQEEYQLGRVQVLQYFCGPFTMTGATLYGWAKSPTWPNSARDTNKMIDKVVQEIGMSRSGPRFILGDLNHNLEDLTGWATLQALGWVDIQDYAAEHWGREHTMTFRNSSITDHILVSPELLPLVRRVQSWSWFADHAALGMMIELPLARMTQWTWPLPAQIPWEDIDYESWRQHPHTLSSGRILDLDDRIVCFADEYENSFDAHMKTLLDRLPQGCKGRCTRTAPLLRDAAAPILKESRPGEVRVRSDCLGREVQKWFQQLRRLQSMMHATKAGKTTAEAVEYRASLWRSIRKARGFEPNFEEWWPNRPTKHAGLPLELPTEPPGAELCEAVFQEFHIAYRRFEAWHIRQRRKLLVAQYEAQQTKIFEVVKKEPKGGLHFLETPHPTTILGSSTDGTKLHVDLHISIELPAELRTGQETLPILSQDEQVVTVDGEWLVADGTPAEIVEQDVTTTQILRRLESFWSTRWNKGSTPSESDWSRIIAFAQAYIPRGSLEHHPIGVEEWMEINTRYGPKSARGPDGFDPRDLQRMPYDFQAELVGILNTCEDTCYWPKSLRTGFVHSLAKIDDACRVNHFRPVIIYPTIYRSWGSLRSKSFLRHLSNFVDQTQLGFIPGREVAELWMLLQAIIELGVMEGSHYAGFVTDLKKAFESLPRAPIWFLAKHLGLPGKIVDLWAHFLSVTERRFIVEGAVGNGVLSDHGFPEGCSLSCTAMTLAGISLHHYMHEFGRRCRTLSYVDNLELLAKMVWDVHANIMVMQAWCSMWHLELDIEKSFLWATDPKERADAAKLGWNISKSSKDLGAQMNYGKSGTVTAMVQRIASLAPLWPRLKRCVAPIWQELKLLRQSLWPKAFYGSSICTLGWSHVKLLRTEAMKSLGFRKAGASPALRLGIVCHEQCDPGFYQIWQVFLNFKRIALKRPFFVQLWHEYMNQFQGVYKQGPFAKMLEACNPLKWTIDVPYVADRDGVWHDWLHIEEKVIYQLLKDAWNWRIWEEVRYRKDMGGLQGIDKLVIDDAQKRIPAHHLPVVARLRDGSFMEPKQHANAWAVIDVASDSRVARGALGGLGHCADHAELRACIAALEYAIDRAVEATIWTDCAFAAEGMNRLLLNPRDLPQGAHQDDWIEMQGILWNCRVQITVQHVPGHSQFSMLDQDIRDWAGRWNDRADREAKMALALHGPALCRLHRELWGHHEGEVRELCELQDLHIAVAYFQHEHQGPEVGDEDEGDEDFPDPLVERGCPEGQIQLQGLPISFDDASLPLFERFGNHFVNYMMETLRMWEESEEMLVYKISFLELAIYGLTEGHDWMPTPHASRPNCWMDRGVMNYSEPTVGAAVRLMKQFFKFLDQLFSLNFRRRYVSGGRRTSMRLAAR
eukprot:s1865_g7.t1